MERIAVTTAGGRALDAVVNGPKGGDLVLDHHGTPGSCRPLGLQIQAAAERGLRLARGRDVASASADAEAILDAVGAESCFVTGASGGGPHALACAALLGYRVRAVATIAGVAPHDAKDLDWTAGMGAENVEELAAARDGEDVLGTWLATEGAAFAQVTGPQLSDALGDLVDDVDRRALTPEVADEVAAEIREGLAPGLDGWLDDDLAFVRSWGFDLGAIRVPVTVWQGGQDRMVPQSHGRWLAANVSGATARFDDAHGHISLLTEGYGEVLDDLLGRG